MLNFCVCMLTNHLSTIHPLIFVDVQIVGAQFSLAQTSDTSLLSPTQDLSDNSQLSPAKTSIMLNKYFYSRIYFL